MERAGLDPDSRRRLLEEANRGYAALRADRAAWAAALAERAQWDATLADGLPDDVAAPDDAVAPAAACGS